MRSCLFLVATLVACSGSSGDGDGRVGEDAGADTSTPSDVADSSASDSADAVDAAPVPCLGGFEAPRVVASPTDTVGVSLIASDDEALYLVRNMGGGRFAILRKEKSDSTVTELYTTDAESTAVVAILDGERLFVESQRRPKLSAPYWATIARVPTHPGEVVKLVTDLLDYCAMAAIGDRLYVSSSCTEDSGDISYLSATGDDKAFHYAAKLPARSLVSDGEALYAGVIHNPGGDVVRLALDGTTQVLAHAGSSEDPPRVFGVDGDSVFYNTFGHAMGTSSAEVPAYLYRVVKSGGEPTRLWTGGYRGVARAELDCTGVVWWDNEAFVGVLRRVGKGGGAIETIVATDVQDFTLDARDLYWIELKGTQDTLRGSARK